MIVDTECVRLAPDEALNLYFTSEEGTPLDGQLRTHLLGYIQLHIDAIRNNIREALDDRVIVDARDRAKYHRLYNVLYSGPDDGTVPSLDKEGIFEALEFGTPFLDGIESDAHLFIFSMDHSLDFLDFVKKQIRFYAYRAEWAESGGRCGLVDEESLREADEYRHAAEYGRKMARTLMDHLPPDYINSQFNSLIAQIRQVS